MTSRGRRLAIFLPVVVTVVLAAVVGALIVVQDQRQSEQVAEADAVAEAFLSDVGTSRVDVLSRLQAARGEDPAALRRVLEAAIAEPPRLETAPAHGAEQSQAYAAAVQTENTFLEPYQSLSRQLRRADVAQTFIAAAREALKLRASDYVESTLVDDSSAVRSRLIPAFVAARDELAKVRVPKGQEKLAATVRGAVQHVIDQATVLADSIDANRAFSFTYAQEFQVAIDAVDDYATTVDGDLTEALNALADD
nr:hypothetical protein [Aeromicrobium sp.]